MVDVAEGASPVDRVHNLLLEMTGRVDDDAINSAREMLGGKQLDAATEFLTGCLVAGQVPVTAIEKNHLRRLLEEVRSDGALADRLHTVESIPDQEHRFKDYDEPEHDLAEALAPIAARLAGVQALRCTWRTTPAGVTYGAVPQRVLLAEVSSDGSVAAAGYQLIEALRRAGLGCAVEVFTSGADLPEYHRNALAVSRQVHLDMPMVTSRQTGASRARAPRTSSSGGTAAESAGGHDLPGESAPWEPERRPGVPKAEEVEAPEIPVVSEVAKPSEIAYAPEVPDILAGRAAEQQREGASGDQVEISSEQRDSKGEGQGKPEGSKSMHVPAAVDAKLTDRERNLLRKLHEELAQREHDRDSGSGNQTSGNQGSGVPVTGTGGFPPISATASNQNRGNQQPS